jgi:hypothetical protein
MRICARAPRRGCGVARRAVCACAVTACRRRGAGPRAARLRQRTVHRALSANEPATCRRRAPRAAAVAQRCRGMRAFRPRSGGGTHARTAPLYATQCSARRRRCRRCAPQGPRLAALDASALLPPLRCAAHTALLCAQMGWTPLHCATAYGRASVVTLLCERGADMEAKDIVRHARHARACADAHSQTHSPSARRSACGRGSGNGGGTVPVFLRAAGFCRCRAARRGVCACGVAMCRRRGAGRGGAAAAGEAAATSRCPISHRCCCTAQHARRFSRSAA